MPVNFGTLIVGICLLACIMLSGCSETPKAMSMPPAVVQIDPVTVSPFIEKSDYMGTVKSRKSVTLSPNVEGHIIKINATSGQLLRAGQTLILIDSRMQTAQVQGLESAADSVESDLGNARSTLASLRHTLISKQANADYTKTQLDRYKNLRDARAVSQGDLDNWKNNSAAAQAERDATLEQIEAEKMTVQKYERSHKQALANLQAQKENLKYYEISAPFTGVVGDIPVKVGDRVTANTALTTITENHPLEVYVSVPAEKAGAIHSGMKVSLAASDGTKYGDSTVFFVSPVVDSNSQTVLVKTLYPNTKNELRADQTVQAEIAWQSRGGISVPTKAVLQVAGKYFVFVAQGADGKLTAHQAEIEVLGIEDSKFQVKSGLKPTDRIVVTGIQRLGDGAPISEKVKVSTGSDSDAPQAKEVH